MNHFTRLIELTSADETYVASLATALAPSILRPKTETSLTLEEKHAYRLIRDLFTHKDPIFSELKRMSTLTHSSSVGSQRPRAISTDESNRRANMEERNRALLEKASGSRSRATSPNPGARGHRRDKSTGGPETRFPIQTSPTAAADRHRTSLGSLAALKRQSLEVPGGAEVGAPVAADTEPVNGSSGITAESAVKAEEATLEKRNSLGRSAIRFSGGRRGPQMLTDPMPRGVTLEDRPMEN
jgi:hypothetical protein